MSPSGPASRTGRCQVLERAHLDRPLTAERGQPLRLVQRLAVLPRHLQHDPRGRRRRCPAHSTSSCHSGSNGSPRLSPSVRSAPRPGPEAREPFHARLPAHVGRRLQVGGHAASVLMSQPYGLAPTTGRQPEHRLSRLPADANASDDRARAAVDIVGRCWETPLCGHRGPGARRRSRVPASVPGIGRCWLSWRSTVRTGWRRSDWPMRCGVRILRHRGPRSCRALCHGFGECCGRARSCPAPGATASTSRRSRSTCDGSSGSWTWPRDPSRPTRQWRRVVSRRLCRCGGVGRSATWAIGIRRGHGLVARGATPTARRAEG